MGKRVPLIMAGAWQLVSTFAWRHTTAEFAQGLLTGVLLVLLGTASNFYDWARYACAAIGAWLVVWVIVAMPRDWRTYWSTALVGVTSFIFALLERQRVVREPEVRTGPVLQPAP